MNSGTLTPEVITFIKAHEHDDLSKLLLKKKEILGFASSFVANQINGRRRAKEKLPTWYANPAIVYPPQENLAQCSSEVTAVFKTNFIRQLNGLEVKSKFHTIVDLSGGFGVDSFFLGKLFSNVIHVEPNVELLALAEKSHQVLGPKNIEYVESSAEDFLKVTPNVDWIYIDPSRKSSGRKTVTLADSHPNVLKLLPVMFQKADNVLIKTSPLMDLKEGARQLINSKNILVVSVNNECKEVLFHLEKNWTAEPIVHCINLEATPEQEYFLFKFTDEARCNAKFSAPLDFIYEPNSSILKAGAFKSIAPKYGHDKIAPSTHLYTSNEPHINFPGRIFKIIGKLEKGLDLLPDGFANIISKNHPLSPAEIKKKYKIKDGGEKYVLAFSGLQKKYLLVADRLK
jgi:THUMP domain-like